MNLPVWFRHWMRRSPKAPGDVSNRVRQWLATRTFHHGQFADIRKLIKAKEQQGATISLCLPALNEERTIGKEIVLLRSELMSRHPLLDEIVVIDSGSTDRTREIASSFGAQVYLANDILPDIGGRTGKGENLWKALYQVKGDMIIYIDTDIANIRPHFAYGLVGPLLEIPDVVYVKAFYNRPLMISSNAPDLGGGRVTEILIRPLFSMFFPELTAFIQPLSGEYAARRRALEQIPFPIGYGVETAHLLDIYHRWGLSAFAQTDLDQRIHRNQFTHDLGKMAVGILQTFFKRLEHYGDIRGVSELSPILRQFQLQNNVYEQVEFEIREEERPPMIEMAAYREKFNRET